MNARRPNGNWLNQNYDKLILVAVLVLLLFSSLFLVLQVAHNRKALTEAPWDQVQTQAKSFTPIDVTPYETNLHLLENPFQTPKESRRLLVGELRVKCVSLGEPIPYNAEVCPFCGAAQPRIDEDPDHDGDGIPSGREVELGLNPYDASDASLDADGDLFSNVEEVTAGTDMKDPAVFPSPAAKLRIARVAIIPFKLRFMSVSKLTSGDRYQLNMRSLERTYFVKMGESAEGFKVVGFEPTTPEGPALTLEQGAKRIRLIQGQVISQDERVALLVSLLDGSTSKVQVGSSVTLKDRTYKVIDIRDDRVVIREEQTNKDVTISFLSAEERLKLQSGFGGGAGESAPVVVPGL